MVSSCIKNWSIEANKGLGYMIEIGLGWEMYNVSGECQKIRIKTLNFGNDLDKSHFRWDYPSVIRFAFSSECLTRALRGLFVFCIPIVNKCNMGISEVYHSNWLC